jgi:hypothetical protein
MSLPESLDVNDVQDSDESDSENYLVLYESDSRSESDTSSESETENEHYQTIPPLTSTRSGRRVGHWSTRFADFVL